LRLKSRLSKKGVLMGDTYLDKGMGRLPVEDSRDFMLRAIVGEGLGMSGFPRRTKTWAMFNKPLDQGREGSCVGHGWKHFMLVAPIIRTKPDQEPTAVNIYREATYIDEWQGNEGDMQSGTSVRAGAQVLRRKGHIGTFAWADNVGVAIDWLCHFGPLVIGVNWYRGMGMPDSVPADLAEPYA
jgi:hypothetical protein